MFLQHLEVTGKLITLVLPELQAHLHDHEMWEDQRANDYPAAGLKHARDYFKEHDPEVLKSLDE